jgi:hypothetical protein
MKKFLRIVAATLLVMMLFCTAAFADSSSYQDYLKVRAKVAAANAKVYALVAYAMATPYDDVSWLLRSVNAVNYPVIKYAEYMGFEVECEYQTFYIDGRWVDVDPLKVINVLP